MNEFYPLIIVALGVIALLILIMKLQINTFISLIIVSFLVAFALKMPVDEIVGTITDGMGGTLGSIALIFGFGAILGKLVSDAGGAQRIAMTLINRFGEKHIQWAVVIASFIIGIALFFEVGLVLLIPIVYQIAKQLKVSILYLGISMAAALSVTHGFLPPHPGPTVIAQQYEANIGMVLVYGFIIAVPTLVIAGPLFTKLAKKLVPEAFEKTGSIDSVGEVKEFEIEEKPPICTSILTAILPIFLLAISIIIQLSHNIVS